VVLPRPGPCWKILAKAESYVSKRSLRLVHSNRYSVQSACEHCEGAIRHETWCITVNPRVFYANQIIIDAGKLTEHDTLILHSLGVSWNARPCDGTCQGRK
jgi:hypothetical protein